MANDKETLLGMGFDPARVNWALKATGNRGLQPAMDHLLEHESEPVPDLGGVKETESSRPSDTMDEDDEEEAAKLAAEGAEAKSIKCSECGKVFKNTALANFHAEKSGHDQFEESTEELKPLTEEEKKQKLAELQERMAAKRMAKAEQDKQEAKANEDLRRKSGKDMGKIKEELRAKEAIKEAEQRRRDKIEDAKARAAVKAQIEADKKARAEKAAREKALREGRPITDNMAGQSAPEAAQTTAAAGPTTTVAGKDYKETRLQIRLQGGLSGGPYQVSLDSEKTLRDAVEWLGSQNAGINVDSVTVAQHFPRKTFSISEFGSSLRDLGLTPSAVLIVTSQ